MEWRVMDTDVIIVGAGPTGLMLASELCLAEVRPLVLERRPGLRETPKANGFSGQILQLLRYRGLSERFGAVCGGPIAAAGFPFGGMEVDLTHLVDDPPLQVMPLPQPQLERLLDERAAELGADIRRGHEVIGAYQNGDGVTVEVRGPESTWSMTARYLVGCDGAHSRVRDIAGIAFPGTTYPEVNRLAQVAVPDWMIRPGDGALDVPELGRIDAGFTRTDSGVFALGWLTAGELMVQTTEDERAEYDDDAPMTLNELQESIRRVLGAEFPLMDATRLSRYQFRARQAERYRNGRLLLAGDAAHQVPATGIGINLGMLDAVNLAWKLAADIHGWAPASLLDTYHTERHLAGARALLQTQAQVALRRGHDPAAEALRTLISELLLDEQALRRMAALIAGADIRYPLPDRHPLTGTFAPDLSLDIDDNTTSVADLMHNARPILLDLADRVDVRQTARDWRHRIDIRTATSNHRPADALLIRPDAHIAWAAAIDEPTSSVAPMLRGALSCWLGAPLTDSR
jgi:2-polyprenyl-6-methoxyphenol hydroxylase-like FAD-dependent oxidoreductase